MSLLLFYGCWQKAQVLWIDPRGRAQCKRGTSRPSSREAVAERAATGWEAGNCFPRRLARLLEFNYQAVERASSLLKSANRFSSGKLAIYWAMLSVKCFLYFGDKESMKFSMVSANALHAFAVLKGQIKSILIYPSPFTHVSKVWSE